MKFLSLIWSFLSIAFSLEATVSIVPLPQKCVEKKGHFTITDKTMIYLTEETEEMLNAVSVINDLLKRSAGYQLNITSKPQKSNVIDCRINKNIIEDEAYKLFVSKSSIKIEAKNPIGIFYALQSVRQLLPASIESSSVISEKIKWEVPCVEIEDAPAFSYRGLMLDVSRHFKSKEFVKRYIDLLSFHKLNTFHWHLTDDQGWRIEIKKYPNLTIIGGFRNQTLIGHGKARPFKWNMEPYGGFYTQEDIKEVVEYANKRFVEIIPEIEMPGHSTAALASYPEFSCSGGPFDVIGRWGVFNDIFCTKDTTFSFLEDVLTEITELFPSKYIHIGGDEAPKVRWERCAACQQRMKEADILNEEHLQSYFVMRIENFLKTKGKQIIGWDDILNGKVSSSATIMSWQGVKGGLRAAKEGHKVIMSPNTHCYFDFYQTSDKESQPLAIGGFLPLEKVYSYYPIPENMTSKDARNIKGIQANLWSEYMPTESHTEYMTFPRAAALSEICWTEKNKKDFESFNKRLDKVKSHYDIMGINYYKGK